MAYERRDLVGGAVATTLSASLLIGASSTSITSSTGWASGTNGPFFAVVDEGVSGEEKIKITGRSGTNLSGIARGQDGTTESDHDTNAPIRLCHTATDDDEANYTVAQTVGKVTTAEDILVATGTAAFKRLGKGAEGTVLGISSSALAYVTVTPGSSTITTAMLQDDAVTIGKLADAARYKEVTFAKSGVLVAATTGTHRWYALVACTVVDAWASVGTAPTGASVVVNVLHNGSTILTPTITASTNYASDLTTSGDVTLAAGEYLTVDIVTVGSSVAGSDLTVGIRYYET